MSFWFYDECPTCGRPTGNQTVAGPVCNCIYHEYDLGYGTATYIIPYDEDADIRAEKARMMREELTEYIIALADQVSRRPEVITFTMAILAMTCKSKLLHSNRMGPWLKR